MTNQHWDRKSETKNWFVNCDVSKNALVSFREGKKISAQYRRAVVGRGTPDVRGRAVAIEDLTRTGCVTESEL